MSKQTNQTIATIVAVDKNLAIGNKGKLLAHLKEDMKFFRAKTTGSTIIMGRTTFESLPNGPLPNRKNIIISHMEEVIEKEDGSIWMNLENAKEYIAKRKDETFFIIGGGTIYKQMIDICNKLYITEIEKEYDAADTYFPSINKNDWKLISESETYEENDIKFKFKEYEK